MKFILGVFLTIVLSSASVYGGIGIAVYTDKKDKAITFYEVAWVYSKSSQWRAQDLAKKRLEKKLNKKGIHKKKHYSYLSTLTGGKKRGHHLNSGYYVVVRNKMKIYDGSWKVTFGLGASDVSYGEAEKRAVSNLAQYNWSWNKKYGYTIDHKDTFKCTPTKKDSASSKKNKSTKQKLALVATKKNKSGRWFAGGPTQWVWTTYETEKEAINLVISSNDKKLKFLGSYEGYRVYSLNRPLKSYDTDVRKRLKGIPW